MEVTTPEEVSTTSVCVEHEIKGNIEHDLVVSLQVMDGKASQCSLLV